LVFTIDGIFREERLRFSRGPSKYVVSELIVATGMRLTIGTVHSSPHLLDSAAYCVGEASFLYRPHSDGKKAARGSIA
jgi:hypothetical protein